MVQRAVDGGRDAGDRRREGRPGLLLHADPADRRRPGQRDRPGGGLRAGARGHRLRRRRRRRAHRQQLDLRPVRRGVRQPGARAGGGPPHPHRHVLASTAATTSAPTARSAGSSSPASAARWASPGSRSSWSARRSRGGGPDERPLDGIRVLEVAMYGFVPSAGAVLADWGADVIKVEHAVTGDPQRGLRQTGTAARRGRPEPEHRARQPRQAQHRSGHVRARGPGGAAGTGARADVFLTSFLPGHRQKFGIDVDDIRAVNPKIIYARGSALGPRGEEAVKGGYDMTAFWCRAGTAATITPPGIAGHDRPARTGLRRHHLRHQPRRRHRRGAAQARAHRRAVGRGRLAARQRPVGDGPHRRADQRTWASGWGPPRRACTARRSTRWSGLYPTADDRYISFVMMQPTKFWADVCRHMDLDDLADDPRFATAESIAENTAEAVEILREAMAKRPWPSGASASPPWPGRGRRCRTPCRPPRTPRSGPTNTSSQAGELELVANPVQFDVSRAAHRAGPGFRRADRGDPARTRPGLGPHHRAQDGRRSHLGSSAERYHSPCPTFHRSAPTRRAGVTPQHRVAGADGEVSAAAQRFANIATFTVSRSIPSAAVPEQS